MATSSRQSNIFGVNDWKTIYKTFSQANFQSYDYETLRKSFVDYLRTYYPETFNDFTESSEYVALLDIIAFMGQSLAFRDDLNTRENFIDTAERRDSVIKLANLVGYNPKRNLAGEGYLKIASVQTSENITDINGYNLSGQTVIWNDPANPAWQEQFNTIFNASLISTQRIGRPGNTQTILGTKVDEYSIRIPTNVTPVVKFNGKVEGSTMAFEAVSASSIGQEYIYEVNPKPTGKFNILYKNDSLGYGSPNTGFFLYFKQGTMQTYDFTLTQQLSNQVQDIAIQGVNDSDTWLYKVDPITGELHEWTQVESVYINNNSFSDTSVRTIFSVKSRFNDQVSYTFGDGVFGEMPIGNFRAYVRAGNGLSYTIDPAELQSVTLNMTYVGKSGRNETLTLTVELTQAVTNAKARETLADIKLRAPTKYYAQNRMVNGEDYNTFPHALYSSIIKSKAINRGSIGVSKNFDLLDPTGRYSSTNNFSQDGGLYATGEDEYHNLVMDHGTNNVVTFLTSKIFSILASRKLLQYYNSYYTRYNFPESGLGSYTWKQTSYSGTNVTGYFNDSTGIPAPIGVYTSGNIMYVTTGALLMFTAPVGYFYRNGRLVAGIATPSDRTFMWTKVTNIVDDGYNGGRGNLYNGLGPVTVGDNIPTGSVLSVVLPAFDNVLPTDIVQLAIAKCNINQSFSLIYDNSLSMNSKTRWQLTDYSETDYLVNFKSLGNGDYLVTNKSLSYYFGSVGDTRFTFDRSKVIYDPLSGKLLYDYIKILKTNSLPDSNLPFADDFQLAVVGQTIEKDGYPDDYSVEVSCIDPNTNQLATNPDFFNHITGYGSIDTAKDKYVVVKQIVDANLLTKFEMVPATSICFAFGSKSLIEVAKYDYPVGQIFFAYNEIAFYTTVEDSTSANIFNVQALTGYTAYAGRQGLFFQYRHNSSNTTRVNPATSNIVDMYLVTQSYYTQYINWLRDTTNTLDEPTPPTIEELTQSYGKIDDYKMMTDSVILNSVKFKPLFGSKAEPKLRATIKVIKASTVTSSDSEIQISVINTINDYFTINNWDFGDTFYFSELSSYLHSVLGDLVSSVIILPKDPNLKFGDLYEIRSAPNEIFVNAAQATDIQVITALTANQLQA